MHLGKVSGLLQNSELHTLEHECSNHYRVSPKLRFHHPHSFLAQSLLHLLKSPFPPALLIVVQLRHLKGHQALGLIEELARRASRF